MRSDSPFLSAPRSWLLAGAVACVLALLGILFDPKAALKAWLAAAFLWSGVPIGALALLMMMRLIPGAWGRELAVFAEAAAMLMPLAFVAFVPVLFGVGVIYDWAAVPPDNAFQQVYLVPWFFSLRTLAWFLLMGLIAVLLVTRRVRGTPLACAGLMFFTIGGSVIAVDWLMSLDPEFHSSGFGLYVLSIQMIVAMTWLLMMAILSSPHIERPGVLGGLLLTALLAWTYLAFMQYFIIWSENLPSGVVWYRIHAQGGWSAAEWIIAILHLLPLFLLLLPLRRSTTWLYGLSILILFGEALQSAWLVLPDRTGEGGLLGAVLFLLAAFGLGCLFAAGSIMAVRNRIELRAPEPETREATS